MCLRSKVKWMISSFNHLLFVNVMLFTSCFWTHLRQFATVVECTNVKTFCLCISEITCYLAADSDKDLSNRLFKAIRISLLHKNIPHVHQLLCTDSGRFFRQYKKSQLLKITLLISSHQQCLLVSMKLNTCSMKCTGHSVIPVDQTRWWSDVLKHLFFA